MVFSQKQVAIRFGAMLFACVFALDCKGGEQRFSFSELSMVPDIARLVAEDNKNKTTKVYLAKVAYRAGTTY